MVPVLGKMESPECPQKAGRARRWIEEGKALPKRRRSRVFCVQLEVEAGNKGYEIVL